ncbi:hypothetical protein U1Q18_049657, partial [Sarracenia purpurea var. burkii]
MESRKRMERILQNHRGKKRDLQTKKEGERVVRGSMVSVRYIYRGREVPTKTVLQASGTQTP